MNIKELGNYELVNENTDNPVLIGTPRFYNFSVQTKGANSAITNYPVFNVEEQLDVNDSLRNLIYAASDFAGQSGNGCGYWWYITDVKSEYITERPTVSIEEGFLYYLVISATVVVVQDANFPATSPSGV